MNKRPFDSFSDPEHLNDQSGDFEAWEEWDEEWNGEIWDGDEWDTDEHLTPPRNIYRPFPSRRPRMRPLRQSHTQPLPRRVPITHPSLPRVPHARRSLRGSQTQPSLRSASNLLPSRRGRTKFHFPGGRRVIALLVGLLGTAVLLGGIYNLTLWSSIRAYTPLGANQTLVEQVCVVHAQANDTFITITPYDQEQNLSSSHPVKIYETGNTFTAQLEITHIPWFLNWLRIPNGYQVSNNMNQPLESNNWLLQTSSVPVPLNLNIGNQQIGLYNLIITDQGASFQRVPHSAGKCN